MQYILFTDLVGSTTQSQADPVAAASQRRSMIDATLSALAKCGGRVSQYTGDGFLCLTSELKQAITAGQEIIRAVKGSAIRVAVHCSASIPESIRVLDANGVTREDVELGSTPLVIYFDHEAYTDIAKAARILALTNANQILVSERAYSVSGPSAAGREHWNLDFPLVSLKDFKSPEHVYEYLWDGQSKGRPGSVFLPTFHTRRGGLYIDRPAMEDKVVQGLHDAAAYNAKTPITVLLGDGGMGKTRLAEEVALRAVGMFRKAAWVNIAGDVVTAEEAEALCESGSVILREKRLPELADRLRENVADRLGFAPELAATVRQLGNLRSAFERCLAAFCQENPRVLLILDNWEPLNHHDQDARSARAACEVLDDLKRSGSEWAILVTSRERPRVGFPILEVAVDEGMTETEAVKLIGDRWEGYGGKSFDEDEAKRLALACDKIPLAMELAASVKLKDMTLSLAQVADAIEKESALILGSADVMSDDPAGRARHASMLASLTFSYNLLDPEQQRVFRAAGIFVAPWSAETGNFVLASDGAAQTGLVRASRLRAETRLVGGAENLFLSMHRAAWAFSRARLAERSDELNEVGSRLSQWTRDVLREISPVRFSILQAEEANWMDGLLQIAVADSGFVIANLYKLQYYGGRRGRMMSLAAWPGMQKLPVEVRTTALELVGNRHFMEGRNAEALASWDQADEFYSQSGSPLGRGNVARSKGDLHFREGRNAEALVSWEQADEFYSQSGSPQGRGNVAKSKGDLHFREGRNAEALVAWEQADEFYSQSGDPLGRGNVAKSKGDRHFQEGKNPEALAAWEQADAFYSQSGDPVGRGLVLEAMAGLAKSEGRAENACRLLREAEALSRRSGAIYNADLMREKLAQWGCEGA